MQYFLGLAIFISVSASLSTHYRDDVTVQMDLGSPHDGKWTAVKNACWRDATNGVRAVDHAAENFDESRTTPSKCRAACIAEGYALAAVEFGHECWCGNTIAGNAHPVDDAYCNKPCTGDDKQTCGGFGYMNLWAQKDYDFSTPGAGFDPSSAWKPLSCYKDVDANNRLLPFQPKHGVEPERLRTVEGCIEACQGHGYDYAGLENGAECWCGGTCPPAHLKGGKCDMPCKGNGKQYCGGQHSLLVFRRDDTTRPGASDSTAPPLSRAEDQTPVLGSVNILKDQVRKSKAIPRQVPGTGIPGLPKLPFPLPKLPKVPKLPLPLPELPHLPDIGDIVKQIKPIVSNMFTIIQSDISLGKKTAGAILDRIPKNPLGPDMDAFLVDLLKDMELDAANPVGDAIAKIKAIITTLFDKIAKDIAATKTAALLLLDHLPGHSLGMDQED